MTKQEILEALAQEESGNRFLSGMLVGVGLGALVGAAVALLLAPRTGVELRNELSARARDMGTTLSARAREMKGRLSREEAAAGAEAEFTPPETGV